VCVCVCVCVQMFFFNMYTLLQKYEYYLLIKHPKYGHHINKFLQTIWNSTESY